MSIIADPGRLWNKEQDNMATAQLLDMNDKKSSDKQKALDSALAQIERQFGKGSIMKLGGENKLPDIEATSTGSLGLDIARARRR